MVTAPLELKPAGAPPKIKVSVPSTTSSSTIDRPASVAEDELLTAFAAIDTVLGVDGEYEKSDDPAVPSVTVSVTVTATAWVEEVAAVLPSGAVNAAETLTPEPSPPSDTIALAVNATTESMSVIVAAASITVNPDTVPANAVSANASVGSATVSSAMLIVNPVTVPDTSPAAMSTLAGVEPKVTSAAEAVDLDNDNGTLMLLL